MSSIDEDDDMILNPLMFLNLKYLFKIFDHL